MTTISDDTDEAATYAYQTFEKTWGYIPTPEVNGNDMRDLIFYAKSFLVVKKSWPNELAPEPKRELESAVLFWSDPNEEN
jgi:hypothetical protein